MSRETVHCMQARRAALRSGAQRCAAAAAPKPCAWSVMIRPGRRQGLALTACAFGRRLRAERAGEAAAGGQAAAGPSAVVADIAAAGGGHAGHASAAAASVGLRCSVAAAAAAAAERLRGLHAAAAAAAPAAAAATTSSATYADRIRSGAKHAIDRRTTTESIRTATAAASPAESVRSTWAAHCSADTTDDGACAFIPSIKGATAATSSCAADLSSENNSSWLVRTTAP